MLLQYISRHGLALGTDPEAEYSVEQHVIFLYTEIEREGNKVLFDNLSTMSVNIHITHPISSQSCACTSFPTS